jgi:phosphopantothenoylcysteine synthetase/decarboxylase
VIKRQILVGVTGSISAYRSADLVSSLREEGHEVMCVMTESATRFLAPLTLEILSGHRVATHLFNPEETREPVHTRLANWADLVIIYPASASLIGKVANGICDEILSCILIATHAPVVIAPAMNDKMYQHPAVQKNIERLKEIGYTISEPTEGKLACGYKGIGHITDIETVVACVRYALT